MSIADKYILSTQIIKKSQFVYILLADVTTSGFTGSEVYHVTYWTSGAVFSEVFCLCGAEIKAT